MNRARFRAARVFGVTVLGLGLLSTSAFAASDDDVARAQNEISAVGREVGSVQTAIDKAKSERLTVEQRLANGELLFRSKDYERATVVLSEIIEGYPDTPSYVDALWLRGETFYTSSEYLSARRDYRAIVKHGNEPRYASYVGKALARLVDVCIRIGDIDSLDEVFQNLGLVPSGQADAALTYAKGKAYYAKKSYGDAKAQFAAVPANPAFTHQAHYFLGLVAMKEAQAQNSAPAAAGAPAGTGKYKAAIDVFKQVTDLPPDTDEHRHVIDLAWMAIGRLAYEMEQFQLAAESYLKVGRESPEFDTMLYETAWVYVRLGDVQRAERALEVLSIADPDSSYLADGTLLRADLLLRAGAFDKALQLYTSVRGQYDPMRSKVESAAIAARSGCDVVIAGGRDPRELERVLAGEAVGTWFPAHPGMPARHRWIAWATAVRGHLVLDEGAVAAVRERGASLLAAGVRRIEGTFRRGDVVELRGPGGDGVGRGIVCCDVDVARRWCAGERPSFARNHHALVHRDHLVLYPA